MMTKLKRIPIEDATELLMEEYRRECLSEDDSFLQERRHRIGEAVELVKIADKLFLIAECDIEDRDHLDEFEDEPERIVEAVKAEIADPFEPYDPQETDEDVALNLMLDIF